MAPILENGTTPTIHIASLVSDSNTVAQRLSDVIGRLVDQFSRLGVRVVFDVPQKTNSVSASLSSLDDLFSSVRLVNSSVDRLELLEQSLRESLTPNNPPTTSASPVYLGGRYA